ncbi:hypothetical protein Tco_1078288 [Tanacetum coccineum]
MKDDLKSQAANPDMWKVLKAKFEKSSVLSESERRVRKKQKTSRGSKSIKDSSSSKQLVKESQTTSYVQQQQQYYDVRSDILEIDEDEDISEDASI